MTEPFPQRRSPRLKDYDYSQNGAYFITICTQNRTSYFGHIDNQMMHLNPAGEMIHYFWHRLAERYPAIDCDCFVVMPNHIHGILVIADESPQTITDAVRWFKSFTTNQYGKGVREKNWQPYQGKLWQRSFHDHIIRDDETLNKLREYTIHNPALWEKDELYA